MTQAVQKLVTEDSFVNGVLVPAGHLATYTEDQINGNEEHIKDVGDFTPAMVQIAPISPTGPNPTIPQQIPADAVQMPGGAYAQPGKVLVAEVTKPQEARIDDAGLADEDAEAKVSAKLEEIMGGAGAATGNPDDGLVAGTVAEIKGRLGAQTDEQLEAMRAAERDREKPRAGVLDAIADELETRKANAS